MAKFRHEYKHWVDLGDIRELQTRLGAIMRHDKNADENGMYMIKSLYFDNYQDKAFREKQDGLARREKFRIRFYNDDPSFIRLEKKSKIDGLCLKEQCKITREQTQKIIDGDLDWMRESEYDLIKELYAKMHYQLLKPKNIVTYDREIFVYDPGNVRVTFDENIRGSQYVQGFFDPLTPMTKVFNLVVLEVKWDEYLPQIIRDIVQLKNRRTSSFSKYAGTRFV